MRELVGLTQEELSERLSVSYQQIWRWEQNKVEPGADIVVRLAKELRVSSDYLLGLSNEPLGHMTDEDLSPNERKLIAAVRNRQIVEAVQALATLTKDQDHPIISPDQPAVNS
jgi:transcriptional regulator with XRE-family HTH domain